MNPNFMGNGRFPPIQGGFNPRMGHRMMPNMMGMQRMYPGMGMGPGMFPPPNMMGGQHFKGNNQEKRGDGSPQMFSIYIGDLDESCEQNDLTEFFQRKFRSVVGAKVIKDYATKKNKGFGFVHFEDGNEAEHAITEMNGVVFRGKRIKTGRSFAKYANPAGGGQPNHRGPNMYPMMNRGMPSHMGMPMGMRRPPMMPPGPYPRQPYPMMPRPQMDQNHQKNIGGVYPKQNEHNDREENDDEIEHKNEDNHTGHYRRVVNKSSPSKQPSYMISTTQEVNKKNDKPDSSGGSRNEENIKTKDENYKESKESNKKENGKKDESNEKKEVSKINKSESKKEESKIDIKSESKGKVKRESQEQIRTESKNTEISKPIRKGLLNKRDDMDKDGDDMNI